MPRVRVYGASTEELGSREYRFTVIFQPLMEAVSDRRGRHTRFLVRNPARVREVGYQVTVPLLPGLVTYGRTLAEARAMARDAIRCHLEGMRKAGEPIPNERKAHTEKLRVALSA